MERRDNEKNEILNILIKNSIITSRQFSIIYNKLNKQEPIKDITSGAYYRQIKQCREKIKEILYSIILLSIYGAIDKNSVLILEKTIEQIESIVVTNEQKNLSHENINNVISLIDQIVARCIRI